MINLLPLLALLLPPPSAPAFMPQSGNEYAELSWPTTAQFKPASPFGQCIAGDFTNMVGPDAFIIKGGRGFVLEGLVSLNALTTFQSRTALNMLGPVMGAASMRGTASGGLDSILLTDFKNGLTVSEFNSTTSNFDMTVINGTNAWKRTTGVTAKEVVIQGSPAILIVGVNEETVRTYTWQAGVFTEGATLALTSFIRDVAILNYDGLGDPEIACMADNIQVLSLDLTSTVATIAINAQAIEAVAPFPSETEDVLVVAHDLMTDSSLDLWVSGVLRSSIPLTISAFNGMEPVNLPVTDLLTGDWTENGADDIIITHTAFEQIIVIERDELTGEFWADSEDYSGVQRVATSEFEGTSPLAITPGKPAFYSTGAYDRNTLVMPFGVDSIGVTRSPVQIPDSIPFAQTGTGGSLIKAAGYHDATRTFSFSYQYPDGTTYEDWNHIQVNIWKQLAEPAAGTEPYVEPIGTHVLIGDLPQALSPGSDNYIVEVPMLDTPEDPFELEPPTRDDWPDAGPIFWFQIRFVNVATGVKSDVQNLGWRCEPGLVGDALPGYEKFFANYHGQIAIYPLIEYPTAGVFVPPAVPPGQIPGLPTVHPGFGTDVSVGSVFVGRITPRTQSGIQTVPDPIVYSAGPSGSN